MKRKTILIDKNQWLSLLNDNVEPRLNELFCVRGGSNKRKVQIIEVENKNRKSIRLYAGSRQ